MKTYILPASDYAKPLWGSPTMRTGGIDKNGRLYLAPLFWNKAQYQELPFSRIAILDPQNDALYQIKHDLPRQDETLVAHYLLGEDQNIYLQLVTEEAHFIYKITPQWDKKVQGRYETLFADLHPELKKIWYGEAAPN